jgi:type II secretory pathway pseudopilin PulG
MARDVRELRAGRRLPSRGCGGFTLVEIVLVVGLMAVVLAASAAAVKVMATSSGIGVIGDETTAITHGLNEYRLTTNKLPAGSSWPAALSDFVEPSLRSRYSYKCDSSTGNKVTLTTTYTFASNPTAKLKDRGLCTNDANTTYNADTTVTCRLAALAMRDCI